MASSLVLAFAGALGPLEAHDTFFRVPSHEIKVSAPVEITVLHGTFDQSVLRLESSSVNRLELHGPDGATRIDTDTWELAGWGSRVWVRWQALRSFCGLIDKRLTSRFSVTLPVEGTYIVAMTLNPGGAAMNPAVFDAYLHEHDLAGEPIARHGVTDANAIFTERYTKFVKIILQAGQSKSGTVMTPCGLSAEFVPLSHPFDVRPGGTLGLQLLLDGVPLAGQPVIVGRPQPSFGVGRKVRFGLRSDEDGRVEVAIDDPGVWWVSFVHIVSAPAGDEVAYESRWATLSFEIQ